MLEPKVMTGIYNEEYYLSSGESESWNVGLNARVLSTKASIITNIVNGKSLVDTQSCVSLCFLFYLTSMCVGLKGRLAAVDRFLQAIEAIKRKSK